MALCQQPGNQGDDPGDTLAGTRKHVGRQHVERRHVRLVKRGLFAGQAVPRGAKLAGSLEHVIVDISHVLHVADATARGPQRPHQDVEHDVGEGVTEVGCVVGGDPADVYADRL